MEGWTIGMGKMKMRGTSILFVNNRNEVLLLLRDDIPGLPHPGMWDIPGGGVEEGETPEQCIAREMKEEMGLDITPFHRFRVTEFPDRTEYTFWKRANLDIRAIRLTEGQRLKWFSRKEAESVELAFGFNRIVDEFFKSRPDASG